MRAGTRGEGFLWRGGLQVAAGRVFAKKTTSKMQSITLDGYRLFSSNGKEVQVVDNSNPDGAAYPPVIDTAQAAELLCMNVERVRRYVREGRLPAYQLPGSRVYRFIYSEVIDYIKSHPVHPDMARR